MFFVYGVGDEGVMESRESEGAEDFSKVWFWCFVIEIL